MAKKTAAWFMQLKLLWLGEACKHSGMWGWERGVVVNLAMDVTAN